MKTQLKKLEAEDKVCYDFEIVMSNVESPPPQKYTIDRPACILEMNQ